MIKKLIPFVLLFSIVAIPLFISSIFSQDLKVIKKNLPIKNEFVNSFSNDGLILFFGYVGCTDICTPKFNGLSLALQNIPNELKNKFQFVFINLKYTLDKEQADLVVKSFDESFNGYTLSEEKTKKLANEFGSYYSRSLFDKDEINHSDKLYFLKKEGTNYILKAIYTSKKLDTDTLEKLLQGV